MSHSHERRGRPLPSPLPTSSSPEPESVEPLIEHRVQRLTRTPPLTQRQYALLFQTIAAVLSKSPYRLTLTSKVVRDRLVASGERISRETVSFVLKGMTYTADSSPVSLHGQNALELAQVFVRNVVRLCARKQLELLPEDRTRIEVWIAGGVIGPQASEVLQPGEPLGAHPEVSPGPDETREPTVPLIAADSGVAPPVVDAAMYLSRAEPLLLELEQAWARGAPGPVLEECARFLGPQTFESYRACIRKSAPPSFRRALLAKLLKQFALEIRPPRHVFPARADVNQAPSSASSVIPIPLGSRLFVESAEVSLIRVSQAIAARCWGVWYALDSPDMQARLEASWSQSVVSTFETNLREMNRLSKRLRLDKALLDPGSVGFWFEQLVMGLLNEELQVARRAPLHEDLFEKTDLRVSYPTLQRKRGARVQVTLLTDERRHGAKLRRIAHGEEFVVVSPLTLAEAALGMAGMPSFPPEQRDAFFAALSQPAPRAKEVAAALKSHFRQALGNPASPLGPVLAVASPIRRFIRMYVEREAHDATRHLRTREAESNVPWSPPPWLR